MCIRDRYKRGHWTDGTPNHHMAYLRVHSRANSLYFSRSVLYILAISGTRGSSGFGSHKSEQIDNRTFEIVSAGDIYCLLRFKILWFVITFYLCYSSWVNRTFHHHHHRHYYQLQRLNQGYFVTVSNRQSLEPVSYTHLDVYKRQKKNRSSELYNSGPYAKHYLVLFDFAAVIVC